MNLKTEDCADNSSHRDRFSDFIAVRSKTYQDNLRRLTFIKCLSRELSALGIDCMPLKGIDLLIRAYPSIGMREMADIDLLIKPKDITAVKHFFENKGYARKPDEGLTFVSPDRAIELDIIWDFWYLGSKTATDSLWHRSVFRYYEDFEIRVLHPEDAVLYLVAYTVAHKGVLSPTFASDLNFFLQREKKYIEWEKVYSQISNLQFKTAFFHAITYAGQYEMLAIPEEFLNRLKPKSFIEKVTCFFYKRNVTESAQPRVSYIQTWLSFPGFSGKVRLLREKLLPTFLELQIQRNIRTRSAYVGFILIHPFLILIRGTWFAIRDLYRIFFQ